jgi:hypothetical protein
VNPFQSLRDYEEFIYTLRQHVPAIERSTLIVIPRGRRVAIVRGELTFAYGYRMTVEEWLTFDAGTVVIESYGYEVWHNTEKIAWYDAQPHPTDTALASTYPHHKHLPPDIKHHRLPAPEMSFGRPNLPVVIREIETLIEAIEGKAESR